MKRIGVVSDTHIPRRSPSVPQQVLDLLAGVDLILHAGDMEIESVMDELGAVAPVRAVSGNMDAFRNEGLAPDKLIVTVEDCRIGLMHGWGGPDDLPERIMREFDGKNVQAIVFGHSHTTMNERRGGILLFNPGSPTDTRFAPFLSIGFLTVDGSSVSGEIIRL